ncbi:hypothetical protein SLEP1_g55193 [Rubroshorea leprosula]|uniref:Calcium-transporting ATPase n=1 Tax=Rubroshorea leprosula TaxID=152421 RepID=A0AAV5MH52_9ROSI|nr:hypothetical protein SLEP1_g55193 [Rubroshorea leprosula]
MTAILNKAHIICTDHLLDGRPASLNKYIKKWHLAFVNIYCSRTFFSLVRNHDSKASPIPDHVTLTIPPDNGCFKIDETTLTDVVKEKKLEKLQQIGGVNGVASSLQTSLDSGIKGSAEDIARRRDAFGSNTYKKPPSRSSFFHFLVQAFKDFGCAALSLIGLGIKKNGLTDSCGDGGSIFMAIFLVIAISSFSKYIQNKQFEILPEASNDIRIDVIRGGRRQQISIFDIVVGDIVCLKIGDQVPADGLFLYEHSLQIGESSMTGESDHVEVNSKKNPFLISGTKVVDGDARMLVTSVGMNTTWGQMMSHVTVDNNEQTLLQVRLNKLTSAMRRVCVAVAFMVLIVLLVGYFTRNTTDQKVNTEINGSRKNANDKIDTVAEIIAAAFTIVVVAIPEELSSIVALTLAYSMKKMMADQVMVRKLFACETMGSATVICTDKTGTLTLNQMKVTRFWQGKEAMDGTSSSISSFVVNLIHQGVALNTTRSVCRGSSTSEFQFFGNPTEKAILSWAVLDMKMDQEEIKKNFTILFEEPFDSRKKRSGVLIKKKEDNTVYVHWKGAAETILAMCSSYYDGSGVMKDLNGEERMEFKKIIRGMAASSLRCIAFAHKQVAETEEENVKEKKKLKEENLTLLGLVGIKDSCRPGVKKAVEDCQHAGVKIKMITGDDVFTARAIATECGILRSGQDMDSGAVVEGEEFQKYTPEERMEKVEKICVMARSSPSDKLLMVQCLKQKGHVVAVTGDGTNDTPALKKADIGLSMGIQGTEVAKASSDVVILDDNFDSVTTVLKWGRCVYTNIQKFIQFQLTINVTALVINSVATISTGEVPLTAVQLLWVNLIMDNLASLALATEEPTMGLMKRRPVGRTEPLITNIMWRNLLAQAFYQVAVLLILQFRGESIFNVTEAVNDTLIFNTFVLCQVFNEFNARKLEKKNVFKGIHKNNLFLGIVGMTIVLQVLMVEFLKQFAGTERLNWGQWGACIAMAIASWPIGSIVKCIPVPERPIFSYLKWKKRT